MRFLWIIAAAAACAWAQSALDRSWLGRMIDTHGFLRPVSGVSGAFVADAPVAEGVLSTACSRTLCLAKTDAAVLSLSGATPAPPGPAEFALDGDHAVIFFPLNRQFARWREGSLEMFDLNVDGEVLSVRSDLTLAIRRGDGVWIVSANGAILDSLPDETGPVLLADGGIVYATPESLVLRRADGSEVRFPAPGVAALFALGDGYIEARAAGALYTLHIDPGHERLYLLPQPQPRRRR